MPKEISHICCKECLFYSYEKIEEIHIHCYGCAYPIDRRPFILGDKNFCSVGCANSYAS